MILRTYIITRGLTSIDNLLVDGIGMLKDCGNGWLPTAQTVFECVSSDVVGLIHDDLTIHDEDWKDRVLKQFEDEQVAICGFGGASSIGHSDIYKIPYDYTQLARSGFKSNLVDAESHGERFTGECDVAVLDSFSLFIRRSFLESIGGWPVDRYAPSHCADIWVCLKALEQGMKVRLVGLSCTHTGGGAGAGYHEWAAGTKWGSDAVMHRVNHRLLYEEFRKVLPVEVK